MRDAIARFELAHERGRTVHLYGDGAVAAGIETLGEALRDRSLFVVTSAPILERHEAALAPLRAAAGSLRVLMVPDGEAAKSVDEAEGLWRRLLVAGARRDSRIVAFGGGSVSDLAGFVAGSFLRGLDWVAVPTTLLAQVDAAIGGKTGVDLPEAKNAVGLFHHPLAVLAEPAVLATLAAAERRSGLVEVVKVAAILDAPLFDRLERDLDALLAAQPEVTAAVVAAAARAKAEVVAIDPSEQGPRALLNFGHTLGHALEAEIGYGVIAHGDAVAHGLRFALRLSREAGCDAGFADRLESLLGRLDVPPLPPLEPAAVLRRLAFDKKARAGGLGWVLLEGPGRGAYGVSVDSESVELGLAPFLERAASGSL